MKQYINHFFSLHSAPELLPFYQTSSKYAAKEMTESFAMWRAAIDILHYDHRKSRMAIVVGDGCRPRTAALLAYMTKWSCYSIDPTMNLKWFQEHSANQAKLGQPIQRLRLASSKIQDRHIDCQNYPATLFLPHAHVGITPSVKAIHNYSQLDVVAMPCCTKIESRYLEKHIARDCKLMTYVDCGVWSPKNQIYIWQNMKEQHVIDHGAGSSS